MCCKLTLNVVKFNTVQRKGKSSIRSQAGIPHHVSFPCRRHRYVELSQWRVVRAGRRRAAAENGRVERRSTESPETLLTLSINGRSETQCQADRSNRRAAMPSTLPPPQSSSWRPLSTSRRASARCETMEHNASPAPVKKHQLQATRQCRALVVVTSNRLRLRRNRDVSLRRLPNIVATVLSPREKTGDG